MKEREVTLEELEKLAIIGGSDVAPTAETRGTPTTILVSMACCAQIVTSVSVLASCWK